MTLKYLATLLVLLKLSLAQIVTGSSPQLTQLAQLKVLPCVSYRQGNCVGCPYNYHINQNQCYLNVTGCLSYNLNNLGLQQCNNCDPSSSVSDGNGGCSPIGSQLTSANPSNSSSLQSVAQQYGDSRFQVISISMALADPYFLICNNYMLTGTYSNFISRTTQPINAVSFFSIGNQNQYKILYYGSGGGLMMSIITINTANNAYQLNAFVSIGTTSIIDNCGLYDETLQCVACAIGYHLQNNYCFPNIAGCNSYSGYICLQCTGYAVLIENRCIGCNQMGDLAKVAFFDVLYLYINSNNLPFFSQNYLLGV